MCDLPPEFDAIWIPWHEVKDYEADGWERMLVVENPTLHDHYSALMVRDVKDA